ncbi:hypothetical protein Q6322_30125 [Klebsiella pneumoniae]|nr:hypothetical protein [Klebsiella pneumoniae]MDP0908082.1 hypothetical protein [Klebsiella pneumoniae]
MNTPLINTVVVGKMVGRTSDPPHHLSVVAVVDEPKSPEVKQTAHASL